MVLYVNLLKIIPRLGTEVYFPIRSMGAGTHAEPLYLYRILYTSTMYLRLLDHFRRVRHNYTMILLINKKHELASKSLLPNVLLPLGTLNKAQTSSHPDLSPPNRAWT